MKIAFICDMHLPANTQSPQYAFLTRAIEQMHKDEISKVICLGDITSYGEKRALDYYLEAVKDMEYYYVLGNADVIDITTHNYILKKAYAPCLEVGTRRIIGINTLFFEISAEDRSRIEALNDGDILFLHHAINRLADGSRTYLEGVAGYKSITIIHGHSHKRIDYMLGRSHVIGLRALDPDKTIGDYPNITYFDITDSDITYEEKLFEIDRQAISNIANYMGISCEDNHRDIAYAIENGIRYIELRCNGKDWIPDNSLFLKIERWRKQGNSYLSLHMPNVYWQGGGITGKGRWYQAINYAKELNVDGLTIHPPRIQKKEMQQGGKAWKSFLELYTDVAKDMPDNVKIGIENLHMKADEKDDDNRGYGYTPQEILAWIDAINNEAGLPNRVGHLLDVGHARNNGHISQELPISRWYEIMGDKTVAYHIHQVVSDEYGNLKNHQAITDWFGPGISYSSFFYMWLEKRINYAPVFLEVRGCKNFEDSLNAFKKNFVV